MVQNFDFLWHKSAFLQGSSFVNRENKKHFSGGIYKEVRMRFKWGH